VWSLVSSMNVKTLLEKNRLNLNQTVYFDQNDSFLKYPLFRLGLVNVSNVSKYLEDFPSAKAIVDEWDKIDRENGVREHKAELEACLGKIKSFKHSHGKNPLGYDNELRDKYENLICLKKSLIEKIEIGKEDTRRIMFRKYKVSIPQNLKCLKIRAFGVCNTLGNVRSILPRLGSFSDIAADIPVFTYDLSGFTKRMERQISAIEGGPCIIGVDELYLILQFKNGRRVNYDFITGCEEGPQNEYNPNAYQLAEIVSKAYSEIVEIDILKKQHGVTFQHLVEVHRLMSVAKALDLPVVIGIPDHAYKSQWRSVLSPLKGRFDIAERIEATIDDITNEFVLLINDVASELGLRNFEVLHSKNEPVMRCFLQAKNGMSERPRRLTRSQNKRDAVLDYICMPALPHYVWGATNILEINNVAEFESLKGTAECFPRVSLSALMFPFVPNLSGSDSMYHSKNDEKLFIRSSFGEAVTKCQDKIIKTNLNLGFLEKWSSKPL